MFDSVLRLLEPPNTRVCCCFCLLAQRRSGASSCCEFVLAHACRHDHPSFPDKSKALAAQDTNIRSILFRSCPSQLSVTSRHGRIMEALIAFNWYRCDTKPNLEMADHAVMMANTSRVQRFIASAVWCLGLTYSRLGIFKTSNIHLRNAYELFNTLPPDKMTVT